MQNHSTKLELDTNRDQYRRLERQRIAIREQIEANRGEWLKIERAIQREEVRELVGQRVKRRIRTDQLPELNDAVGVLLEARRTRGVIDYGDLGKWYMPLENILPEDGEQGEYIVMGVA